MKFADGPYAGKFHDDDPDVHIGEPFVIQQRCKIDGGWYDVDHLYELLEDGTAEYQYSEFVWRETLK